MCYTTVMPRIARIDVGDYIYHVLNRANARAQIFDVAQDYIDFEMILEQAVEDYDMRLLAYCLMPNHWHLVVCPRQNGDMSKFMSQLTNTHTRRWHTKKNMIGQGHLYQGRYKSFMCETGKYFLTLVRYVERNAKKAKLKKQAEQWRWSSVWRREYGTLEQKKILSPWPIAIPKNYVAWLNEPQSEEEEDSLERSVEKNTPYGSDNWAEKVVDRFDLRQTIRGVGRPCK